MIKQKIVWSSTSATFNSSPPAHAIGYENEYNTDFIQLKIGMEGPNDLKGSDCIGETNF